MNVPIFVWAHFMLSKQNLAIQTTLFYYASAYVKNVQSFAKILATMFLPNVLKPAEIVLPT